jgi:hypothetical protein
VKVADKSPMVVVNQVRQLRMALPTFVNFPTSHAYREGGLGLVWDTCSQRLVEPNVDERELAIGFPTGLTSVPSIFEASR